jgi:Integrase core domain
MATRRELKDAIRERYQAATERRERRRILSEFVRVTGYHRKHALRVLNRSAADRCDRVRQRLYDEAVHQALAVLWEASDRICSKRLRALIPTLIEAMQRTGHLQLDQTVKSRLLDISAASIDRLLTPEREAAGCARRRRWGAASAIRQSVPVRTFADWGDPPPGYFECDMVEHCGGIKEGGNYVHSLTLTDIHSGWTECVALTIREQTLVVAGIDVVAQRVPFALCGIDTDNDSAFMNETLQGYCRDHSIHWTRSRAYHKNDQAWVEQKNGAVVRRLAGYGRLSGLAAAATLQRLYESARLYVNFFQPSFKLASKQRNGTVVHKRYHPPLTPHQRLLASDAVDETIKQRLLAQFAGLDPVVLLKNIRQAQRELLAHSNGSNNVQPSPAQPEYFDAFATAWHSNNRAPQSGRRKMTGLRWWRTRSDPFAESWSLVESWLMAEPNITAQELMARLTTQLPDLYPTRAQLRTLQRRVKAWRAQWARQLVFAATSSHRADRELALIETEAISNRRGE